MNKQSNICALQRSDIPHIKSIIDANDMFPSALIDDMVTPYFDDDLCQEKWIVITSDGKPSGLAYVAPERMTEGTWNLLLIAVTPENHGLGLGTALISHAERELTKNGARLLLVETSGLPDYAKTRTFYPKCGYREVARIPEYYDQGDDKVVFWKKLN